MVWKCCRLGQSKGGVWVRLLRQVSTAISVHWNQQTCTTYTCTLHAKVCTVKREVAVYVHVHEKGDCYSRHHLSDLQKQW